MKLRFYWKDPRVKPNEECMKHTDDNGDYINLISSEWINKIWMPDIHILHTTKMSTPSHHFQPSSIRYHSYFEVDHTCL